MTPDENARRPSPFHRLEWIDVARGLAIILIIVHHSRDYALVLAPPLPSDVIRWAYFDPLLVHIRLPLFFTISGMVSFGLSSRPAQRIRLRRVASLTALYAGWSVVMLLMIPAWPNDRWVAPTPAAWFELCRGGSVLWYLWALTFAYLFTAATIRLLSPLAVLAALLAGACLIRSGAELRGAFGSLGNYLPLYVMGARYGGHLARLSALRDVRLIGVVIVGYFILLHSAITFPGVELVRHLAGAATGILVAAQLAGKWPSQMVPFAWLGRRTLPIYVLHFPIVALLGCAALRFGPWEPRAAMLLLFLPILAATTFVASLILFQLAERMGLAWAFAMKRAGKADSGIDSAKMRSQPS